MVVRAWANTRAAILGKCRIAREQVPIVVLETFVEPLPAFPETNVCLGHSFVVQRLLGIGETWSYCTPEGLIGKAMGSMLARDHHYPRSPCPGEVLGRKWLS